MSQPPDQDEFLCVAPDGSRHGPGWPEDSLWRWAIDQMYLPQVNQVPLVDALIWCLRAPSVLNPDAFWRKWKLMQDLRGAPVTMAEATESPGELSRPQSPPSND